MSYKPDRILIDEAVFDSASVRKILQKLPQTPHTIITDANRSQELSCSSITQGKKKIYLKSFPGEVFKLCPGSTDGEVLCCDYHVLDIVENCPLECTYCILQAFLNNPLIVFHANYEEALEKMFYTIRQSPGRPFRIGTGEHSDSMAMDHIFDVNPGLVERFAAQHNATLELKTKTDYIEPLLGLNHNNRTVIAWSLNPVQIIKENEFKTATLEERLSAAKKVTDEGYKVAFHFDPMIYYKGWKAGYKEVVEAIFDYVSPKDIAWISMGTLRYIPALKQISEERFPGLSIFANEFSSSYDGKMRYIKKIRKMLLGQMSEWIYAVDRKIPLYICMEKFSFWESFMGGCPKNAEGLERFLDGNISH